MLKCKIDLLSSCDLLKKENTMLAIGKNHSYTTCLPLPPIPSQSVNSFSYPPWNNDSSNHVHSFTYLLKHFNVFVSLRGTSLNAPIICHALKSTDTRDVSCKIKLVHSVLLLIILDRLRFNGSVIHTQLSILDDLKGGPEVLSSEHQTLHLQSIDSKLIGPHARRNLVQRIK